VGNKFVGKDTFTKGGTMSKIQDQIHKSSSYNTSLTVDFIVENSSIKDIKEHIVYLQKEILVKDETIKELITKNVKLEVKLDSN
jgi:hypothetical protein